MDSVSFGSPLNEKIGTEKEVQGKDLQPVEAKTQAKSDVFDAATTSLSADKATSLARFLKRFVPILIFIFTAMLGIGVGRTDLVSGCLQGVYGEISLFIGAIKVPLYSIPETCFSPDKARDFLSFKPLIFLISFLVVFAIWTYFDKKLAWRGKGNYEKF